MTPGFYNWQEGEGYTMPIHHYERRLLTLTPIYEVKLLYPDALFFCHPDGSWWRSDNHYFSDMGSVPPVLQPIPGLAKDRHLLPYLHHDSGYKHKGLWKSVDGGQHWHFVPMRQRAVDNMLFVMCRFDIEPGNLLNCAVIWLGVRLGGRFSFGTDDKKLRTVPQGMTV